MDFLKYILKRVKLKTLIILIVLLMFNSYAWFVYTTKVSGKLMASIDAWDVTFKAGEETAISNIEFNVGRIYPGMEDVTQEMTAHNLGDKHAEVTYLIREVTILGETYSADNGYTPEDLLELIESADYPFSINITMDNGGIIEAGVGSINIVITFEWPFEQDDDELDTFFGEKAFDFHKDNPTEESINLQIELRATQKE